MFEFVQTEHFSLLFSFLFSAFSFLFSLFSFFLLSLFKLNFWRRIKFIDFSSFSFILSFHLLSFSSHITSGSVSEVWPVIYLKFPIFQVGRMVPPINQRVSLQIFIFFSFSKTFFYSHNHFSIIIFFIQNLLL